MNRGEIVAAVKSYLNRPNLNDTDINTMISSIEGVFNRVLKEHPNNIRRTTFTQPAGNEILPLPVDLMQLILLRDDVGALGQFQADGRAAAAAVGRAYIIRGDCAELFPAPAADTLYHLDYYGAVRPLQGNTDTNWISNYHADLYLYGALNEAAVYLKDDARLAQWSQVFGARLASLVEQGATRSIATAPRIRLA